MPIWNKLNTTWITDLYFNRSLLVGHYYVEIKKEKRSSVISLTLSCLVLSCLLSCRTWSQCMPRRFFIPHARANMALDTRQIFISLKAVLTFQTLMLATLGKRVTTHDSVIFLDKNCSWTLLPGSTWLQTPITRLYRSSSKLQNTFCFFKTCWRLTGYQGFMMPLNHQAGYKVLFKTTLNILVDIALMHHISFLSVWMIYALTLDRFIRHNNLCQKICPRSRTIRNLCLNRYLGFWST